MKKITAILFLSGLVMLFPGCGEKPLPTGDQLEVSWKVISNVYADQPGVKAMFTLVNHSALTLDASNWALYFNQTRGGSGVWRAMHRSPVSAGTGTGCLLPKGSGLNRAEKPKLCMRLPTG